MTKQSKEEQALVEVQQAVLGVLDKMSETLKKAPEEMQNSISKLNKIKTDAMTAIMNTGLTKEQAEYLKLAQEAIEKKIQPLLQANQLTAEQTKRAIQGLNDVKKDVKSSTPPKLGR